MIGENPYHYDECSVPSQECSNPYAEFNFNYWYEVDPADSCSCFPGWISTSHFGIQGPCWNDRTFARHKIGVEAYPPDLASWWTNLSAFERELECALASPASRGAAFDNHVSVQDMLSWLDSNKTAINQIADQFTLDPALLAGVLASEMLYDYEWKDKVKDSVMSFAAIASPIWFGRAPHLPDPTEGFRRWLADASGYANVHWGTLVRSWENLLYRYDENNIWFYGWSLPGPRITEDNVDEISLYALTGEGTIRTAAMVTLYLQDRYVGHPNRAISLEPVRDPNMLTAEDMAIIWGAYRAGIEAYGNPTLGPEDLSNIERYQTVLARRQQRLAAGEEGVYPLGYNGTLALPVMKYMRRPFP